MKPYETECVAGGARRGLPRQLPQLRPRDAPPRGHRRHRARTRSRRSRRTARPATSTSPTRSSASATASACSAASTSTSCTRRTQTPCARRSGAVSTRRWTAAGTSCARPGQLFDAKPGLIEVASETVRELGRLQARPCRAGYLGPREPQTDDRRRSLRRPDRGRRSLRRAAADAGVPPRQPLGRRLRPHPERRHGLGGVEGRTRPVPRSSPPRAACGPTTARRSRSATTPATGRSGSSCARQPLELDRLGGLPFAAHVSDPCDGRTQGTTGMFDSLPYRNDAALVLRRLVRSLPRRRGVIGVGTCDKGLPAMLMAVASFRRARGRDRSRRRDAAADGAARTRAPCRRSARASPTGS